MPAAWLIERSGIEKGLTEGAVAISSKHPLAIKHRVLARFGVALQAEPVFAGFMAGDAHVEFLKAPAR